MDFSTEVGIFLIYAGGMLAIYFFGRLLLVPLKVLLKLLLNSLLGGLVLLILNAAGGIFGIFLPINWLTAAVTGLLGLPGTIGMLLYFNLPSLF